MKVNGVDRNDVLVIIPAFNEEASVASVVTQILEHGYPVLVVDDGSIDRTSQCAEQAGAIVLKLPVNLGVGGALRCGFRYAVTHGYGVVVQCDADGQHDPGEIGFLLDTMDATGADMVVGSRFLPEKSAYTVGLVRRVAMRQLARVATRQTGVAITDATSGFRAIRDRLLGSFAASYPAEYLGDTVEALARAGRGGYIVREVGVQMQSRSTGVSSASTIASVWYVVRVLAAVWLQRFRSPGPRVVELTLWERERL